MIAAYIDKQLDMSGCEILRNHNSKMMVYTCIIIVSTCYHNCHNNACQLVETRLLHMKFLSIRMLLFYFDGMQLILWTIAFEALLNK